MIFFDIKTHFEPNFSFTWMFISTVQWLLQNSGKYINKTQRWIEMGQQKEVLKTTLVVHFCRESESFIELLFHLLIILLPGTAILKYSANIITI